MKIAWLFASVAALAIMASAYSTARHQAEREAWRVESNRLSEELARLERDVENGASVREVDVSDAASERDLSAAAERLSAIEAEILDHRAELVQLKSDRLVADEYAKSSFEKLRQQVRQTTEIEQSLAGLKSRQSQIKRYINQAEDKVSSLATIIEHRQEMATSLDRKIAELLVREEAARSRLATFEGADMAIARSDEPDEIPVEPELTPNSSDSSAEISKAAAPADLVVKQASLATDQEGPSDQDRSKGLYRFKSLSVDQGLGGPAAASLPKSEPVEESADSERAESHLWARRQYEFGRTLVARAETNSGTRELNEAVLAFKSAIVEWPRDQEPLRWAAAQNDLGYALMLLGQRQGDVGTLEDAAIACRRALEEIKEDHTPLLWGAAQYNLGLTLSGMAEIKADKALWKNAIEALQQSVEVFEGKGADVEQAKARDRLQSAHEELAILQERS